VSAGVPTAPRCRATTDAGDVVALDPTTGRMGSPAIVPCCWNARRAAAGTAGDRSCRRAAMAREPRVRGDSTRPGTRT
jgi:hypothetical protein